MPYDERGGRGVEWKFDVAECIEWRCAHEVEQASGKVAPKDYEDAKTRRMAAMAQLAEIEVETTRGNLVSIDEVVKIAGEEYAHVRSRLLSMPTKLAPLLANISTANEARGILEQEIYSCLDELSAPDAVASKAMEESD